MRQHRRPYLPFARVLLAWENVVSFTASMPRMWRSSPENIVEGSTSSFKEKTCASWPSINRYTCAEQENSLALIFSSAASSSILYPGKYVGLSAPELVSFSSSLLSGFFHDTVYGTRESDLKATTFLLTSHHHYCMVVTLFN